MFESDVGSDESLIFVEHGLAFVDVFLEAVSGDLKAAVALEGDDWWVLEWCLLHIYSRYYYKY